MIILGNGYKLPETGDFGDDWFPALEDNIQRLNDHSHDGVDSEILTTSSTKCVVQSIASGDFAPSGNEFVAAGVNLVGGNVDVDTKTVQFRDPTTKEPIYLRYEKASQTTIDVYTSFVQNFEVLVL